MNMPCELVTREYQFVGQSITANYPEGFPNAAIKVQMDFGERKHEITNAKQPDVMYSPFICNEIFATYFACLEVDEITNIPEGMMGFKLPLTRYAKVECTVNSIGEGYDNIFTWIREQGYEQKTWELGCCPVEVYYFGEEGEPDKVEILIPIKN